jgi:amino acid adenylation domain-containing protein
LLNEFNITGIKYPAGKTIKDLVELQAKKTPGAVALVFDDATMTYKELNERSNRLGHYLQQRGIKPDTLVPVCIERGMDMIVGILGIIKAGGAYVPVDPDYPPDRIRFILQDVDAQLVVSNSAGRNVLPEQEGLSIVSIDEILPELNRQPVTEVRTNLSSENLAYVIYTSGSTGQPKGVMIEHRNVVRLFENDAPLYDFNEQDVWSLFHSICFDFSVWEMYGALFYGGRLIIVPKHVAKNTAAFGDLMVSQGVTVLNQTPSAFYVLQEYITGKITEVKVRYVIFGGEALNPAKLKPWSEQFANCRLINMYGITETTVHVTYQIINKSHLDSGLSVIGKPIPTLTVFILDKNRQLVPVGVPGELYVGGKGLARGYLNRAALTAERFIVNPFDAEPGERLYKTGDLGRWLADGSIEYLGRTDNQLKIRGYRIEPGEIENVLQQSLLVQQAVVMAVGDEKTGTRLIAFVVPAGTFNKAEIKKHLAKYLPEYQVPSSLICIDQVPLTQNGKIDTRQ